MTGRLMSFCASRGSTARDRNRTVFVLVLVLVLVLEE